MKEILIANNSKEINSSFMSIVLFGVFEDVMSVNVELIYFII